MKRLAFLLLPLSLTFTGCNEKPARDNDLSSAAQIRDELNLAQDLIKQGSDLAGFEIINSLDDQYPDNAQVIETLAFYYTQHSDNALAAFYFEQLHQLNPNKDEALLNAAQCYVDLGQWDAAARNYESFLQKNPDATGIWKNLALAKANQGHQKSALKAYLTALDLNKNEAPSAFEAIQIGQLFNEFGNSARAQEFFNMASSDHELWPQALLGLISIDIQGKNWGSASTHLKELDTINAELFDSSDLAFARSEIQDNSDYSGPQNIVSAKEQEAIEEIITADSNAELTEVAISLNEEPTQEASEQETEPITEIASIEVEKAEELPAVIENTQTKTPTIELTSLSQSSAPAKKNFIQKDNIAAPKLAEPVAIEAPIEAVPASTQAEKSIAIEEDAFPIQLALKHTPELLNQHMEPATPSLPEPAQEQKASQIEIALQHAQELHDEGQWQAAIQQYWKIIQKEKSLPFVWQSLSEAYYSAGLYHEALNAAQQAIDLQPNSLQIIIGYLKIAQKNLDPAAFLDEITQIKERFPDSPELTLGLARAHEKLGENPQNAIPFYLEFIKQAPHHAKKAEAKEALQRLL